MADVESLTAMTFLGFEVDVREVAGLEAIKDFLIGELDGFDYFFDLLRVGKSRRVNLELARFSGDAFRAF